MNANVAIFLALTAVAIVAVGSALTGIGGSAVNQWTVIAAGLLVLGIANAILARRGR